MAKGDKAINKFRTKDVEIVRKSIMKIIPRNLDAGLAGGGHLVFKAREIVFERLALDQRFASDFASLRISQSTNKAKVLPPNPKPLKLTISQAFK